MPGRGPTRMIAHSARALRFGDLDFSHHPGSSRGRSPCSTRGTVFILRAPPRGMHGSLENPLPRRGEGLGAFIEATSGAKRRGRFVAAPETLKPPLRKGELFS